VATKLSVNLNAVALLRNRRNLPWPSVTALGKMALEAGAHGLTVHPRPDERHVRFSDLADIRTLLDQHNKKAEFNIEGFPTSDFLNLVAQHKPEQVTLVPDDPAQATSDHGWDFRRQAMFLRPVVAQLKEKGMRVSLFANAGTDESTLAGLEIARNMGADRVEFYTGPYGGCFDNEEKAREELQKLARSAQKARELGLEVNAGHDLTVANLPVLIRKIPHLAEVSIGHGLIADALEYGIVATVKRFLKAMQQ